MSHWLDVNTEFVALSSLNGLDSEDGGDDDTTTSNDGVDLLKHPYWKSCAVQ